MIERKEIEAKSAEFQIHIANVERDYVYGWLLAAIFAHPVLSQQLILKGGNCFRKAYFATTRFSKDLDFSTETFVLEDQLREHLKEVCLSVHDQAGVRFHLDKTRVELEQVIAGERRVFGVRLYFDDFYGKPTEFGISVTLDVTEFDRLYLPTQTRQLIHPYSDSAACRASIRCHKLEELLAAKLKCLLQRRHISDVYDLAYSVLINRDIEVNRSEVVSAFLKKTIFEPAPGVAKTLLLELPFQALKRYWTEYIVCPVASVLDWDGAVGALRTFVDELFAPFGASFREFAYFPAPIRNVIMDAATNKHLLKLRYHGVDRLVEPYSLTFKRRQDGVGQEYFYAYDRVGGSSGPGIKALLHAGIRDIAETEETFEPRFPMELSKAGEYASKTYFGSPFGRARSIGSRRRPARAGWKYVFECSYCSKRFTRSKHNSRLKPHVDRYGNACYGRVGHLVSRDYVSS